MEKKTYDAVDVFKWLCAWLVIYIHLVPVLTGLPMVDKLMAQGVCRIAVPFFFATSALLLFRKMGDPKTCARENWKKLWKFCGHILAMYTLWIVIYSCYYIVYNHQNGLPQKTVTDYILGYFFRGGLQQHLWYLIAMVYAAPVVYLLWRGGRRTLIAGCLVFEVACCLEWPYRFLTIFSNSAYGQLLKEYTLVINALLNGVPMMCLGVLCLTDHKKRTSRQWLTALLAAAVLFVAEVAGLYAYYGESFTASGMITRIPLTYCLVNWLFTVDFRLPVKWMGKALRLNSTWIYCAHMLVLMLFHWVFAYQGLVRYILVGGLTVVSGIPYVAVKLLWEKRRKKTQTMQTV